MRSEGVRSLPPSLRIHGAENGGEPWAARARHLRQSRRGAPDALALILFEKLGRKLGVVALIRGWASGPHTVDRYGDFFCTACTRSTTSFSSRTR